MLSSLVQEKLAQNGDLVEPMIDIGKGPQKGQKLSGKIIQMAYGSKSKDFPDSTKMPLVPPFQSIISFNCKIKYSTLVARQAALSSRMCSTSKWELSVNLVLDKPEPSTGGTLKKHFNVCTISTNVYQPPLSLCG